MAGQSSFSLLGWDPLGRAGPARSPARGISRKVQVRAELQRPSTAAHPLAPAPERLFE